MMKIPLKSKPFRVMGGRRQWRQQGYEPPHYSPKQARTTGRKWCLRGNSTLSIPWRESMPNWKTPEVKKKKKGKATNPSLKISHTPTAPSQMHGCLERPPLFFKVSRKTVEKCNRNTEASEGDQVYSQTASISVWSIHVDLSMDCRGGFSGYKLQCRLNLTRQCNLKG